jgi:O-antigen/teichoic acid export membrane protein
MTDVLDPQPASDPEGSDAPTAFAARPSRRNALSLGGGQLITWGITLAWTLIVPRHLGPSGWGLLVTGSSIAGILGVLTGLGTGNYLVREFVRTPDGAAPLLGTSMITRVALLIPAAAALTLYLAVTRADDTTALIIWLAAAGVAFLLLAEPLDSVFQAVERMEYLAAGDVMNKVLQSTIAIGLVLLGFGVVPVAISALVVGGLVFLIKTFWVRKFLVPQLRTSVGKAKVLLRESVPYWTMSLFMTFYVWIDTAMLSLMAPAKVVGWYGIPTRLFGTLQFAANMLSTLWLPRLIAAFEQRGTEFNKVARVPFRQAMILSLPLAFGGAVVAGPLVNALFGSSFGGAAMPMALLSLCIIPLYINIIAYAVLVAQGRQMVWTKVIMGASFVNPLLNLVAIRFFQSRYGNGAIGASLSLLITEALIVVVSLWATRGIVTRELVVQTLRSFAAASVMAVCVYLARPLGLLPQVLVGVVVFAIAAIVLRVPNDEDVRTVREALRRRLGRQPREGGASPPSEGNEVPG